MDLVPITQLVRMKLFLDKSFRPIGLTYFPLKTMEKLVDLHIKEGPLKDHSLNPMQHAYLFAIGVLLDVNETFNNTSSYYT
jgi:hypothetical protein